jgi:DMSO reductase anchor subunit
MHPAFSVIFLTTLIGAGQGLFLALYTSQLYAVFRVLPDQDPVHFYALGGLISLVFLALGLFSSFFHLGRPERAWRSAARWRTSWLSREVIALPAFMALAGAWVFIQYSGWNPHLFAFGVILNVDLSLFVGALASLICLALFLCTGMIYACIKQLQEWATPLTVVNYTFLGLASGFVLATAFASVKGVGLTDFFGGWAIVLTIAAFITRTASLVRNARLKYKSTPETAIGIRHKQIRQKAQGSMAGSFNTREFFHGARERNFRFVKWIFLLLVFPAPLLLLSAGLVTQMPALLFAAFLVQYIGLLAERWFFFAQANHPQNLYYQTV